MASHQSICNMIIKDGYRIKAKEFDIDIDKPLCLKDTKKVVKFYKYETDDNIIVSSKEVIVMRYVYKWDNDRVEEVSKKKTIYKACKFSDIENF